MKKLLILIFGFWIILVLSAAAGTIDDLKKDLLLVQSEIRAEMANLRAAQSEIARIKAVGPSLEAREKELIEKLQALEKTQAEKKK